MAFVCDVCAMRTEVFVHEHKVYTHGTPKKRVFFSRETFINLIFPGSDSNLQICSRDPFIYTPDEQSCTILTVSFSEIFLRITITWRCRYQSSIWIIQQAKPGTVGKQQPCQMWWCLQWKFSNTGESLETVELSWAGHLTGRRAYKLINLKRLSTAFLETVVPVVADCSWDWSDAMFHLVRWAVIEKYRSFFPVTICRISV